VGGLGCNCPRGVHDDPSDEAPEVEDIGEDEPSRMGGESAEAYCAGVAAPVLEAAEERGVAPDSDLDELGTVDKIDVVDKSCGLFCVSSAAATSASAVEASVAVAAAVS